MFCQVQRNIYLEAAARGALRKKVFLKISQNSHENTRASFLITLASFLNTRVSFLITLQASKKILWHRRFPVNFAKFLRTLFYRTPLKWYQIPIIWTCIKLICQKQLFPDVLQNRCFENFSIFTEKHLCWSLFLIKLQKRETLEHRRFPVNFLKCLWEAFFREHLQWLRV